MNSPVARTALGKAWTSIAGSATYGNNTGSPRTLTSPCFQGGARQERRDRCIGVSTLGLSLADSGKDRAPIQGLSIRWGFSRYEAQIMSGSIQSSNYVPSVSGWKLNTLTGVIEINTSAMGSAANAPERQMVSVEVASWSKYDLPKNAANLLQFMEAELQMVPEEYRHAAEFEEFDASYGDESFNARLFLSYSRLETVEELAQRLEKAKLSGTRIVSADGCTTIICDGVVRVRFGNLDAPLPGPEQAKPFIVDNGKVYISKSAIRDATIRCGVTTNWLLRMQQDADGRLYCAGLGVGYPSQVLVSADRFAINGRSASDILRDIADIIGDTKLGQDMKGQVDLLGSNLADQVKAVIRTELLPGGLLHRSR